MIDFLIKKEISNNHDIILPQWKYDLDNDLIESWTGLSQLDFSGKYGETQQLYTKDGRRIYLIGLGDKIDSPRIDKAFRKWAYQSSKHWSETIEIDCRALDPSQIKSVVLGLESSNYKIDFYKEKKDSNKSNDQKFFIISKSDAKNGIKESLAIAQATNQMKRLIDEPSNIKTPQYLAHWARSSAEKYGYECEILDEADLEKDGFHAVLAVGKGSIHKPRLIIVKHIAKLGEPIDIGLAGKGVTFDTGGISIKGAENMHYMKSDMGGGATVLGAVEAVARLNLPVNVIGVVGAVENAVDAHSYRPGDVIQSYSGKTIEVIDTDAEGRLVLADVLNFMVKEYNPNRLIDLATLTGSVVRALGYSAAGMFSSDSEMMNALTKVGENIHERVWSMPMYKEYFDELHSDIADIKNLGMKPLAGAIVAAKFLEYFTENHPKWVHLDIAGVAFGSMEYAKMKSATGYGVRLLTEYIKTLK